MSVSKHVVYLFNAKSQSKSTFTKRRGHLEKENRSIKYIFKLSARIVSNFYENNQRQNDNKP
jgi:hypothetical protein